MDFLLPACGITDFQVFNHPDFSLSWPRLLLITVMFIIAFSLSVQFSRSVVSNSLQPHGLQHLSITNSQSLLKIMSIESVMPSNHLIHCRPLLLLPSIFPSIRVFSHKSALQIRGPEYWSFSFSPFNEHLGFISFRINWFDLLAVSKVFSNTIVQKHQILDTQPSA